MSSEPFFSIGVATYKRHQSLVQTLRTILDQSFGDFEVIVGNNDDSEEVNLAKLGVDDPRVRVINRPRNIGQIENMNDLMRQARGKFFMWMADDDLYSPGAFKASYEALTQNPNVQVLYPSYFCFNQKLVFESEKQSYKAEKMSGSELLAKIFKKQADFIGCYGWFKRELIQKWGGIESIHSAVSNALYGEYILMVRICGLNEVLYLPDRFIGCRIHQGSWGVGNALSYLYREGGVRCIQRIEEEFKNGKAQDSLARAGIRFFHLFFFDNWMVKEFDRFHRVEFAPAFQVFCELSGNRWKDSIHLINRTRFLAIFGRFKVKELLPVRLLRWIQRRKQVA